MTNLEIADQVYIVYNHFVFRCFVSDKIDNDNYELGFSERIFPGSIEPINPYKYKDGFIKVNIKDIYTNSEEAKNALIKKRQMS